MLCIFLVAAYPYDRLLKPPGPKKKNYNHFHKQRNRNRNLQANKSKNLNTQIFSFSSETYFQLYLPYPREKKIKTIIANS